MAHELVFYPVGNGDTAQIVLENRRRILFDYCHRKAGENPEDPIIDLKKTITEELKEADHYYFDVVCFTHADDDHISGSTEFFELDHADKYQGNDRVPIKELWVPACMIIEEGCEGEDRILRQEARHRLRQGGGIRVFSRPDLLKDWMIQNGIDYETRKHLFVDAGTLVTGFNLYNDQVEFFCHSPFVEHAHTGDQLRNEGSIILHATFQVGSTSMRFLQVGDTGYDNLAEIVHVTQQHGRSERLQWDIYNIPHHCSYCALGPDKGRLKTEPHPKVKELLLYGVQNAYMVSSSAPIPDNQDSYDQEQPPHIQAKNTYVEHLALIGGRKFITTMEHPHANAPEPLRFSIGDAGVTIKTASIPGIAATVVTRPPRAGE